MNRISEKQPHVVHVAYYYSKRVKMKPDIDSMIHNINMIPVINKFIHCFISIVFNLQFIYFLIIYLILLFLLVCQIMCSFCVHLCRTQSLFEFQSSFQKQMQLHFYNKYLGFSCNKSLYFFFVYHFFCFV